MAYLSTQYFKWFLTETATGLIYYLDSMGNLQRDTIMSRIDRSLPEGPDGWDNFQISYARNMIYWGVNRSFSVPLKFIGDGARIIRKLFLLGKGIEQPITLVVTKYDESVGAFQPYYSGQLDLTANKNLVAESVTANVMEGGILQLLKSYENSIVELPCDGSIPENIRFVADGIQFNDVFHYQILKLTSPFPGVQPLPMTFISNDGDNIAVSHGDQNLDQPYVNYVNQSSNSCFSTISPMSVRLYGSISVQSDPGVTNTAFYMYAVTSSSQTAGVGGASHAVGLTLSQNQIYEGLQTFFPVQSSVNVNGQITFSFDETIQLQANENLFVMYLNDFSANPIRILGGTMNLSFSSKLASSRVWGITAPNVWKLIGQQLCALASTTDYPFTYPFESDFLQTLERFVLTSGDAVRASTNPNYYQYYNQATLNPQNPNNTAYNQFTTLGPVLKISLADFFGTINPIKPSSIGNQKDVNGNDSIFFEDRSYVLNQNFVTTALGQVANLEINPDTENFFNWLQVGYAPNSYDETSGKYEYNNTSQLQAPIKSLAKVFSLVSRKGRTDSYGFEFTRYNSQGGKSTTFNESDPNWWAINCSFSSFIYDYYKASFNSSITNPASTATTNLVLNKGLAYQSVVCGTLDGDYFTNGNDFSIFMLNQPTSSFPSSGNLTFRVDLAAVLNGLAGDSATITFWVNGQKQHSWTSIIGGVNTPINVVNYNFIRASQQGDNYWFTVDTVRTCTVQINQCSLNINSGYIIVQNSGPINYQASVTQQLVALPLVTSSTVVVDSFTYQVVSYGFQYLRFLSNVHNTEFNWTVQIQGWIQGGSTNTVEFDMWKNGVKIGTVSYNATSAVSEFNPTNAINFSGTDTYSLYDMYWLTASCGNCTGQVSSIIMDWQSTSIKAYPLLRETYTNVSGIPNPSSAFNIPDFTPMRMIMANGSILRSILYMQGAATTLTFQTADKNEFLSTTDINGVTITENQNVQVAALGDPLWLPLIFEFDTAVPWTAKQIFDAAQNGYISFIWKGKMFYGFPLEITIKPALNDSQHWKLLASPANLISDMVDLEWDGVQTLNFMDSTIPYINPLHFVPLGLAKAPQYNTYTMDEDFFVNRIQDYVDKNNYYSPWQNSDTINMQCRTAGLAPVTVQLLNAKGQPIGASINANAVTGTGLQPADTVWQVSIPLSSYAQGKYYYLWTMGTGAATATWISEGIWVKAYWPKTQLYEYSNTRNKQSCIFNSDTPWTPNKRFFSQINRYTPKTKFTTFVNEPQDIALGNAIPYDTFTLEAGFGSGMPDYDIQKFERIFGLDTVFIDANKYSRDADAQVDITWVQGQAKGYCKLAIRKAFNTDGITLNTAGQIEGPQQAGYVINSQAFGINNDNQQFIQVNRSGS